jgi:hypothetical protein
MKTKIKVPYPPTFLDVAWEVIHAYHTHSQLIGGILSEVAPIAIEHGWKGEAHLAEVLKTKKAVEDAYESLKEFNDKKESEAKKDIGSDTSKGIKPLEWFLNRVKWDIVLERSYSVRQYVFVRSKAHAIKLFESQVEGRFVYFDAQRTASPID